MFMIILFIQTLIVALVLYFFHIRLSKIEEFTTTAMKSVAKDVEKIIDQLPSPPVG